MQNLEPVTFKKIYRAREEDGLALFARAPHMHVCAVDDSGAPLLRTFHGVVVDGRIAFHAGDHGGKLAFLDRPVVLSVEEVITEIPSTFIDPVMACPATTYFLSATIHGTLRRVDDPAKKARVLTALMERFQPEGGYAPIDHGDPRYQRAIEELLIAEVTPQRITAKHKLGQNRSGSVIERVLTQLWERGRANDLRAIRLVMEAHPEKPTPAFLRAPEGTAFCVAPDHADAEQVARLLENQYWTTSLSKDQLEATQLFSPAWVVARHAETGVVIASARAISDSARISYVADVIVDKAWRGRGLGTALMKLLLQHPRVRSTLRIRLRTRDAHSFYEELGFQTIKEPSDELVLTR